MRMSILNSYYDKGVDKMNEITTTRPTEIIPAQHRTADQNPAILYLAGLQPTGRRTQQQALNTIAGLFGQDCFSLDWSKLRYAHTAWIRSQLVEAYAPATCNKFLSALRGVLKQSWQLEQMTAENYQRAINIKNVTGETVPAGRELTPAEISALMNDCMNDPTKAGIRDGAIISLMYAGGLRREEVVKLKYDQFDQETGRLKIAGKRNKERTTYLNNGALDAMADWLNIRGDQPGKLFLSINKGDKISSKGMTPQAIYNILNKRADRAKVKDFSPHDLRRTFVSNLLDAGADIATVAKMAGHSSVNTTARYDRRPEQAKQKASGLLHVPYKRRTENL